LMEQMTMPNLQGYMITALTTTSNLPKRTIKTTILS
jgi:hypothetical protein